MTKLEEIRARWAKATHDAESEHYGDCRPGLADGCVCTARLSPREDIAWLLNRVQELEAREDETLVECVNEHLPHYRLDDGTGDEANEYERVEFAGAELERLTRNMHNVRMLAHKMRRTDPINAEHLLRFCKAAGIEGSVLRGDNG